MVRGAFDNDGHKSITITERFTYSVVRYLYSAYCNGCEHVYLHDLI